jgi:hypothetical protein
MNATYRRTNLKTGETTVVRCETEHSPEAFADALTQWNTQQPETWRYEPIAVTEPDDQGFHGVLFARKARG